MCLPPARRTAANSTIAMLKATQGVMDAAGKLGELGETDAVVLAHPDKAKRMDCVSRALHTFNLVEKPPASEKDNSILLAECKRIVSELMARYKELCTMSLAQLKSDVVEKVGALQALTTSEEAKQYSDKAHDMDVVTEYNTLAAETILQLDLQHLAALFVSVEKVRVV